MKSPIDLHAFDPAVCSVDLRLQILSQVPFFAGLPEQDVASVNRLFQEQGFAPGQPIYCAGDPAERLYVLAAGRVKLLRHALSGKDVLLDILTPGEFFGSLSALGDEEYPDTAQALTITCALGISATNFRTVLETYPTISLKVLDIVTSRLRAAHEKVRQLSTFSVEERIAYALLTLANKLGQPSDLGWLIQVPLGRESIAELTGTTTETASRVISQFQKDGLIRTGRQWVAISKRDELEALITEE
jgi:CRP-like cAMP-binding protein